VIDLTLENDKSNTFDIEEIEKSITLFPKMIFHPIDMYDKEGVSRNNPNGISESLTDIFTHLRFLQKANNCVPIKVMVEGINISEMLELLKRKSSIELAEL
jgi:hypothetical protein